MKPIRAIGIVGYKNSGKTSLGLKLAPELKKRGYKVAVVKHASKTIDLSEADTARYGEHVSQVAGVSVNDSAVFFRQKKSLEDIIRHLDADFFILEGFKGEKTFPKIVCLRTEEEAKELFDGLQICAVMSPPLQTKLKVPLFDITSDLERIAELVCKKAFRLPNLNCEACGYPSCYELGRKIVRGEKSASNCPALAPTTRVSVEGKMLPLNPFISTIIANTVKGMLSALKGFTKGTIKLTIEE